MEITGPFLDKIKKSNGQDCCWYLHYYAPKKNENGTLVLDLEGRPVLHRHRPFYESKAKAAADIPRIRDQHEVAGSGQFLFDRKAASDYEAALKIVSGVSLVEVAKFWRSHHPQKPKRKLAELVQAFLADVKLRSEDAVEGTAEAEEIKMGRHLSDLKSRCGTFIAAGFGERYADICIVEFHLKRFNRGCSATARLPPARRIRVRSRILIEGPNDVAVSVM